jgi:hypothetical protein
VAADHGIAPFRQGHQAFPDECLRKYLRQARIASTTGTADTLSALVRENCAALPQRSGSRAAHQITGAGGLPAQSASPGPEAIAFNCLTLLAYVE